jgi:hypothetical protein
LVQDPNIIGSRVVRLGLNGSHFLKQRQFGVLHEIVAGRYQLSIFGMGVWHFLFPGKAPGATLLIFRADKIIFAGGTIQVEQDWTTRGKILQFIDEIVM